MRIAIDARSYNWTGIGRYIRSLLHEYAAFDRQNVYTILTGKSTVDQVRHDFPNWRGLRVEVVDDRYYSWPEQTIFWWQLQRVSADLFHFAHFNVPLLFNRPFVVTIHDATRFIFPGQRRQSLLQQIGYELVFAHAVSSARRVITVSHATRVELEHLPIHAAPITTIYESVDERFSQPVASLLTTKLGMLLGTQHPYILYVGVWMSHKNLERLLEAFAVVRQRHPDLKLVMTGKPKPGYDNLLVIARRLEITDAIIFVGFVSEELLPALYRQARCFVFVSLYEGFGLPALEAAAAGTPVIASNISSIPEVMGSAAQYVNPESVPSIVTALDEVLTDQALRQRLITAGRQRATSFSWHHAAQQHRRVYEHALR